MPKATSGATRCRENPYLAGARAKLSFSGTIKAGVVIAHINKFEQLDK